MPEVQGETTGARPSGAPSTGETPPTPSLEEVTRERDALKQSLHAVARERDEWKVRAASTPGVDSASGSMGEVPDEEIVTVGAAKRLITDSISGWWAEQQRQSAEQHAYAQERQGWLVKAYEEVPEAKDQSHPIYKRAVELLHDPKEGLTRQANGQLILAYPNAEYVAILRAKSLASSAGQTAEDKRTGAAFAAPGGPSGAGAGATGGEMSDEEFMKLSAEARTAYQDRKFLEKHGYSP